MTPLRLQMIEDMKSAGLAAATQTVYIDAVRRLAAYYRRSPDQLSEEEVRRYLLGLRAGLFSSQWRRGSWRMRLRSRAARQRAFRMFEPPAARIRL